MPNITIDLLILVVVIALALVVFAYMFADLVRQCLRVNKAEKRSRKILEAKRAKVDPSVKDE